MFRLLFIVYLDIKIIHFTLQVRINLLMLVHCCQSNKAKLTQLRLSRPFMFDQTTRAVTDGYVDNLSWSIEDILFQHFTAITWKNITRPQYEKISWCNNLLRVRDKRLNLCNQSECLKIILLHLRYTRIHIG